jgi:hypothetical protein
VFTVNNKIFTESLLVAKDPKCIHVLAKDVCSVIHFFNGDRLVFSGLGKERQIVLE